MLRVRLWPQRLVLNAGLQRYKTGSCYTEISCQFSKQAKLLMFKCLTLILPSEIGSKILVCGPCGVDCSSPDSGHIVLVWVSALLKTSQKVQKIKTYKKQKKYVNQAIISILCIPCPFFNKIFKEKLGDILVCFKAVFILKLSPLFKSFKQTHSGSIPFSIVFLSCFGLARTACIRRIHFRT